MGKESFSLGVGIGIGIAFGIDLRRLVDYGNDYDNDNDSDNGEVVFHGYMQGQFRNCPGRDEGMFFWLRASQRFQK